MGKFENDIEQQLSGFRLEPSPQVWNDIEATLQQRRRRRGIAWWWFPLMALVTGTAGWGLWQYYGHNTARDYAGPIAHNQPAATAQPINTSPGNAATPSLSSPVDAPSAEKLYATTSPNNSTSTPVNAHASYMQAGKGRALTAAYVHQHAAQAATAFTATYQLGNVAKAFITHAVLPQKQVLPMYQAGGWQQQPIVRIYPATLAAINCSIQLPATTQPVYKNAKEQQIPVIKQPAKSSWMLTLGGGTSVVTGKPLVQQTSISNIAPGGVGTSGSPSFGTGMQSKTYAKPSTGYFLTAGLAYQYAISRHLQLFTGVAYRYVANNTDTGTTVKNYQHSLQVPLGVQYTFNAASKWKISVLGGAALTCHVQQKWLLVNQAQGYHYNNQLNQKINTSLFGGLAITHAKGWRLSAQFEQGLQTLQLAPAQPYRSQLVGLHLGMPLR